MSSRATTLFTAIVLLGTGFGAGWWARGPADATGESRPLEKAPIVAPRPVERLAPADQRQPEPSASTDTIAPDRAPKSAGEPDAAEQTAAPEEDLASRFRALLEQQAFAEAMNLYTRIERRDSEAASQLKKLILNQLQTYLREQNAAALTGLVDAFLARYYDDLDVLLLLARHHLQSDYLAEAAHTFQLAFTYAYSGAERQKVQRAFHEFVGDVDDTLVAQKRWQDLISFYETLTLLDLTQPRYQLRQAELYLAQGESDYGRNLLRRLTAEPAVAAEAQAMLAGTQTPERKATTPPETVALGMAGSHYHLPLRLNESVDVELIIDTGATTTTISREAFDRIRRYGGVTELGPRMFNTANGVTKGTVYRVDRVRLGSQQLRDVHVAVLPFDMPGGIDGLLGMNILRNFRFQVDQDEQKLYLRPRGG